MQKALRRLSTAASICRRRCPPAARGEREARSRRRRRASLAELTPRQRDVLRLLIEGKTNKLICRELELSESTVKTHLASIFRRLGASSRTQAVVAAARMGLRSARRRAELAGRLRIARARAGARRKGPPKAGPRLGQTPGLRAGSPRRTNDCWTGSRPR
jgi:DNA-binding CsgD family transcriptional regulator